MKKNMPFAGSVITFITVLAVSVLFVCSHAKEKRNIAVEKAQYLSAVNVSELERSLSSYMQVTDTLRILLVDSNGKINDFNKVAKELYNGDKAFRSIQLAPGGDVKYVYPLEGNEEAFGDLFEDPDRRTEAEYARDTGETTLAGPFELYQSGLGIVIRQPIYLEQDGVKDFWGFSIVVLNIPEIFDSVSLNSLDPLGYVYQLWRINPDTKEKQIIAGARDGELTDPVETSFEVPGSTWTLSLARKGGWNSFDELIFIIAGMICISFLFPTLCYALLKNYEQRMAMVELSNRDYLTELYNSRKLSDVLQELYTDKKPFYLVYLDVDRFKEVNDTYGHAAGDSLLRTIAKRISDCKSEKDYAFRIGGDEFVMLIQGSSIGQTIEKLKNALSEEVLFNGGIPYFPQLSIGYANYPEDACTMEELMSLADNRMYHMKFSQEGRTAGDLKKYNKKAGQ
ncbi:sensor domain-containing diguanylate cyclase [uncultured Clostridium sp.]|uniref:sensor domain-containing diguanylate cyclase n=1 Tax=uncultured Clostridium sp. TaxID=59620 RepID=UPI0025E119EE|nr:sensor domain-containing diguanylate cyclase [uncultured Clostridium sp.]